MATRVLTQFYDEDSRPHPLDRVLGALEVAHILPSSLGVFDTEEDKRIGVIWDTLYRYFPSLRSPLKFSYENLNDVSNVIMLLGTVHAHFGPFKLALQPTDVENQYKIKKFFNLTTSSYPWFYRFFPDDELVTFTSHNSRYPLPNCILLETHFHIASILHATGRGELVERLQRDFDEMATLAHDGSTDVASGRHRAFSVKKIMITSSHFWKSLSQKCVTKAFPFVLLCLV